MVTSIPPRSSTVGDAGRERGRRAVRTVGPNVVLHDGVNRPAAVVARNFHHRRGYGRPSPSPCSSGPPQASAGGEETALVIGARNVIRGFVTINREHANARGETRVGDGCFIMTRPYRPRLRAGRQRHHMANNVMIGGHVRSATAPGSAAARRCIKFAHRPQRHAGRHGGAEERSHPVRFGARQRAYLGGLNLVGLKRRGFSRGRSRRPQRLPPAVRRGRHLPGAPRRRRRNLRQMRRGDGIVEFIRAGWQPRSVHAAPAGRQNAMTGAPGHHRRRGRPAGRSGRTLRAAEGRLLHDRLRASPIRRSTPSRRRAARSAGWLIPAGG